MKSAATISVPAFVVTWRTTWKSTLIWAALSAVLIIVNAVGYDSNYPDAVSRSKLVESMSVDGITLLFGPSDGVGSVDGFTEWRLMLLTLILSVWAICTGANVTRGAEERGRWRALVLGRANKTAVLAATCLALISKLLVVGVAISLATLVAQAATGSALLFGPAFAVGLGVVGVVALFAMIAVLVSQILSSRIAAQNVSLVILAAAYVLRAVGDVQGSDITWLSPLAWIEKLTPLTALNPLPFFLSAGVIIAVFLGSMVAINRRDVGDGIVNPAVGEMRSSSRVGGIVRIQAETTMRAAVGWGTGIGAIGFACALVSDQGADLANTSSQIADVLGQNGNDGYLSLVFLAVGSIVALFAAMQVGEVVASESDGRTLILLVAGLSRRKYWTLVSLAGLLGVFLCSSIVALCMWAGLATQDNSLSFLEVFRAMLMWVPMNLLLFGIGMLVFGWWPRIALPLVYTVLGGGLLIDLIGSLIGAPEPILAISLWHHVPRVPLEDPAPLTMIVFSTITIFALLCGAIGWKTRDAR